MYNNDPKPLNAGAYANLPQQDIRLSGDQTPQNQQMASGPDPMAEINQLSQTLFGKPVHELTPQEQIDFENWLMNKQGQAPKQNSGIMAAAPTYTQRRRAQMGGRMGFQGGQLVQPGPGRPGYGGPHETYGGGVEAGRDPDPPSHGGGNWQPSSPPYQPSVANVANVEDAYNAQAVVEAAVNQAEATPADNDIEADPGQLGYAADFTPTDTKTIAEKAIDAYKDLPTPLNLLMKLGDKPVNQYEGITGEDEYGHGDFQYTDVRDFAENELGVNYSGLDNEEQSVIDDAFFKSGGQSDSARDIGLPSSQMETLYNEPELIEPTSGDGIAEIKTPVEEQPVEDTGLTPEQNAALAASYKFGEGVDTRFQNVLHPEYGLTALKPTVTAPELKFAAQGGRIGYDRGGVAGLRQIGKPGGRVEPGIMKYGAFDFVGDILGKGAKTVKKVFKSPVGKVAALAGLGYLTGGGGMPAFLGGSGASTFSKDKLLSRLLFSKTPEGGWKKGATFLDKVSPWKATAGITAISSIPLWARPDNWDQMDEQDQQAWLKDYNSKVAAKLESYGGKNTNVQLTKAADLPHHFSAAEGGRIGLAEGLSPRQAALRAMQGLNDDDEEETKYAASGGRIGYLHGERVNDMEIPEWHDIYEQELKDRGGWKKDPWYAFHGPGTESLKHKWPKTLLKKDYDKFIKFLEKFEEIPTSQGMGTGMFPPEEYSTTRPSGMDVDYASGGRIGAQEGGLMDLGGMEKDYRQEGGFVPLGGKEKADDVPARLSKNEFVFTADAVRAAGGGDIDQGAEVMENVMKNLESGGEVSEDSQGLEGARGMFANAQELQKRIV